MNTKIETFSGKLFDYLAPRSLDMDAESIAHAIGNICRFTGHCRIFYSVAEHSILCALMAKDRGFNRRIQLLALIHDAHEAYVGDINTPLKLALNGNFAEIDADAFLLACVALGMTPPDADENKIVKQIDLIALATEAYYIMPTQGRGFNLQESPDLSRQLLYLAPLEAGNAWLDTFTQMMNGVSGSQASRGGSDVVMTEPTPQPGQRMDKTTTAPTTRA